MKNRRTVLSTLLILLCFQTEAQALRIVATSMARSVTEEMIPQNVTDTFSTTSPEIHSVIIFSGAKAGDIISGDWVSLDALTVPDYEIASFKVQLKEGEERAHFKLSRPEKGWPPGRYILRISLNGTVLTKLPFAVENSSGETSQEQEASPTIGDFEGNWKCMISAFGMSGISTAVTFGPSGAARVGNRTFTYSILPGKILTLMDGSGIDEYKFEFSGDALVLTYSDGSVLNCERTARKGEFENKPAKNVAPGPSKSGQEWQLYGTYCHWSGSSSYSTGSTYSTTNSISFDGKGRWEFGSESSFSSDAAMGYSGGGKESGSYSVQGNHITYKTSTGEQGTARVNMRQNDGRISEIYVNGKLYSPELCN
ncbi:MAG: hypothetical protein ACE5FU_12560 [Nitrospinota bacterium]